MIKLSPDEDARKFQRNVSILKAVGYTALGVVAGLVSYEAFSHIPEAKGAFDAIGSGVVGGCSGWISLGLLVDAATRRFPHKRAVSYDVFTSHHEGTLYVSAFFNKGDEGFKSHTGFNLEDEIEVEVKQSGFAKLLRKPFKDVVIKGKQRLHNGTYVNRKLRLPNVKNIDELEKELGIPVYQT